MLARSKIVSTLAFYDCFGRVGFTGVRNAQYFTVNLFEVLNNPLIPVELLYCTDDELWHCGCRQEIARVKTLLPCFGPE